jgi:uncharacterized protein
MTRVLYLHGFASGPRSTKALYFRRELEAAGLQVETPDLAAGDFEHLTLTGQLGVVERTARGEQVAVIGSSMGGYLAALYAARHPEVTRLVLMAPAFAFARRWAHYLGPSQVAEWGSSGSMEVFHYGENRRCSLSYALMEDAARYEEFPDFAQPALIFHGEHDDVVPVEFSIEFAGAHPNVHLEVLNSGHELTDVLDHMAARVREFLSGLSG